jgi:hypothetical protein
MPSAAHLPVRRIGQGLFAVTLALVLLDQLLYHVGPSGSYGELIYDYVDVTREANVPTFWNAALLILVAAAAALVAYLSPGRATGWWVASVVAFVMSLDESVQLHERLVGLGNWIQSALNVNFPTFAWLIPGVVIAAAGATALWVWSSRQPRATRRGLRLAVVLYGLGAVVVEAIGGIVYRRLGIDGRYRAVAGLEELLEMTACVVAIVAVLSMVVLKQLDGARLVGVQPNYAGQQERVERN